MLKNIKNEIRGSKNLLLRGAVRLKDSIWKGMERIRVRMWPKFHIFLYDSALAINKARLDHLATLGLDIKSKKVLEVGAGIGLLTGFFESRGCDILSTDSRDDNLNELKRRYPHRKVMNLDLEKDIDSKKIGSFEIVFCYGTLYHLSNPQKALKSMSDLCSNMIIIETAVRPENDVAVNNIDEKENYYNQASSGKGSRPTRELVFQELKKNFGYAYITKYQPKFADFQTDWINPSTHHTYRSVFVGSRKPISNEMLLDYVPKTQSQLI